MGARVWETSGIGELQGYLDKTLGNSSKSVCYKVNEEMATGLSKKTMEKAFS